LWFGADRNFLGPSLYFPISTTYQFLSSLLSTLFCLFIHPIAYHSVLFCPSRSPRSPLLFPSCRVAAVVSYRCFGLWICPRLGPSLASSVDSVLLRRIKPSLPLAPSCRRRQIYSASSELPPSLSYRRGRAATTASARHHPRLRGQYFP
jgi:hypothetical protein